MTTHSTGLLRPAVPLFIGLLLATPARSQGTADSARFPAEAAGWGPPAGSGRYVSRWAEDWGAARAAGRAPGLKAIPIGRGGSLTLSAELRLRYASHDNARLAAGADYHQGLLRGIAGADLRLGDHLRAYGEAGTGQVDGGPGGAPASFQNDVALQQLFVEARGEAGGMRMGLMAGRQEFADGPRQLMSVGDGPNLHRTWNGARIFAHGRTMRIGGFAFRATRPGPGAFDDGIAGERMHGVNASLVLSRRSAVYLDPFWIHTENDAPRIGPAAGRDRRDTYGLRLRGRQGRQSLDATLALQGGDLGSREVEAWGLFLVHGTRLSTRGWKPRLEGRLDLASGGAGDAGAVRAFNPLYASSSYLGEGAFLSLSNLALVSQGISVSPARGASVTLEYARARQLSERGPVMGGQMRAYAGTDTVPGTGIGSLVRLSGSWAITEQVSLSCDFEHLAAGDVLRRAGLPSGRYGFIGVTFRY